ncbi:MAG: hypothetical protein ACOCUP_03075, partial [bacterium]
LSILIITILGAAFSLVWTISDAQKTDTETIIVTPPEAPSEPDRVDTEKKLKELEEKVEELEGDTGISGNR